MPGNLKAYKRLDRSVIPSNYRLAFEVDFNGCSFSCREEIHVSIRRPCRTIRMYSSGLRIKAASVSCRGRTQKASLLRSIDPSNLVLSLPRSVVGTATIRIEFSGRNNRQMYGFYRSSYRDNGREKYLLTTDFEPADARTMFPCFDEPSFKATFDLSVEMDQGLKAVSNMPAESERSVGKGRKLVRFMRTPKMSTYILYLGIGDFSVYERRSEGLLIRLVSPRRLADPGLPLDYAERLIRFYESYFGIRYPLPKLDMIAIPDFRAGAMENWGAITFREGRLIGDYSTAVAIKERIAEVIAHEFAHQWFGDLVTMAWWDDLWLNESFATFMSHKALDSVFPEWGMRDRTLDMVAYLAFNADSVRATHPISVRVDDAERIGELFDEISYEKGCMVVHMVEDYVGSGTFRRGLHRYLMEHRHGNASKEDLWNALQEECRREGRDTDVSAFVRSWIGQPGHPVVSMDSMLTQRRFLIDGKPGSQTWIVPVKYGAGSNEGGAAGMEVMRRSSMRSSIAMPAKLNLGQDYFYRVKYSARDLAELGSRVRKGSLSYRDGWGIENDLFSFMLSGKASIDDYVQFVDSYCIGSGYPLAFNTSRHLMSLYGMLYNTERRSEVMGLSTRFHRQLIDECGMRRLDGEPNTVTFLRGRAFSNLGLLSYKPVVDATENYMRRDPGRIPVDLRPSVYVVHAWNGGAKAFSELKRMYLGSTDPVERVRLLQGMAVSRDARQITRALDFSLSDSVRLQDGFFIPQIVSGVVTHSADDITMERNPAGIRHLWPWMRSRWQRLDSRFTIETHVLDKVIRALAPVSDRRQLPEIVRFFDAKKAARPDIAKTVALVEDSIRANVRFMERNGLVPPKL